MVVVRQWGIGLLVAVLFVCCRAPAWACDERVAGSCPVAPPVVASTETAKSVATETAPSTKSRKSVRRTARQRVRLTGKRTRSALPSRSSRRTARARTQGEEEAVPLPPNRPARARSAGTTMTGAAAPMSEQWQPFGGAPLMAFEESDRSRKPLVTAASALGPHDASPAPTLAGSRSQGMDVLVPSSPVAQERQASPPPPAPPPAAAQVQPVKAAAVMPPADNSETSTLRTIFICFAGFLAVGTVLRLAIG